MMEGTCGQGMMQRRNNLDAQLQSCPSNPMKVNAIKHPLKYDISADVSCLYPLSDYAKCVFGR